MGEKKKPPLGARAAELAERMKRDARVEETADEALTAVDPHEYKESYTGMCCGAMVMRNGSGDQCGLPYQHELHIGPREAADTADMAAAVRRDLAGKRVGRKADPCPLAEIRERTFEFEADGAPGALMEAILRDAVTQLYAKAQLAGHRPVDITLTVEVTPATERGGVALKPPRPHVRATVRAWKAVEL